MFLQHRLLGGWTLLGTPIENYAVSHGLKSDQVEYGRQTHVSTFCLKRSHYLNRHYRCLQQKVMGSIDRLSQDGLWQLLIGRLLDALTLPDLDTRPDAGRTCSTRSTLKSAVCKRDFTIRLSTLDRPTARPQTRQSKKAFPLPSTRPLPLPIPVDPPVPFSGPA